MWRGAIAVAAILACGCAVRKQADVYRLVRSDGGVVLIPPGRLGAGTIHRTFTPGIQAGGASCEAGGGIAVQRRGRGIRVTVDREVLVRQPAAWLRRWASEAEARGCVAPGTAAELAERILEALPLDPAAAWRLINTNDIRSGYVDLEPGYRLQVDSPIFRDGAPPGTAAIDTAVTGGTDRSINVEVKASPELLGFERAWYAMVARKGQRGAAIEPLSAERHVNGQTEARAAPATDYFRFDRDSAWYRLLYRADRTIVVVAAASYSELERISKEVDADPSACRTPTGRRCAVIPSQVGVNPEIVVRVQGAEQALPVGSTVGSAIRAGGGRPEEALARLSVQRGYAGRLVPVEFDRTGKDILALHLRGGEMLTW
ncbi:MAG: hypothetical protein JST11_22975 [Acidobacteria bacterium]|nr:hypothetical protein [Acidobacteriota bacterium]